MLREQLGNSRQEVKTEQERIDHDRVKMGKLVARLGKMKKGPAQEVAQRKEQAELKASIKELQEGIAQRQEVVKKYQQVIQEMGKLLS